MLWTPSDGVNIFIVFLVLQGSNFTVLCGIFPQLAGLIRCRHLRTIQNLSARE